MKNFRSERRRKGWRSAQPAEDRAARRVPTTDSSSWWFGWGPFGNGDRLNTPNCWQKLGLDAKEKVMKVDSEVSSTMSTKLSMTSVFTRRLSTWTRTAQRGRVLVCNQLVQNGERYFEIRLIEWIRATRQTEWGNKSSVASVYSWTILTTKVTKLK